MRYYLSDPGHHWYSSLAALAAIAVLIRQRTLSRIASAGCLCGLSSCFTQTKGLAALVGFAVFLWWDCRQRQTGRREFLRNLTWLAVGFAAILLLVNGYFIVKAAPARFFWCTIVYVLKYYPHQADWNSPLVFSGSLQGGGAAANSLRLYENIAKSFIDVAAAPCICLLVLARYLWRVRRSSWDDWDRPVLVAIVGLFLFLSMAPAPSPPRLMPGSLPGFILVAWLLDSRSNPARYLFALCSIAVLAVASYSVIHSRPKETGVLTTAQGNMGFSEDGENVFSEYQWVQQHTHPGEFFFRAAFPDINFYLDLRNPTPLPRITNNAYTTPGQVQDAIKGLEQHRTEYIAWNTRYLDSIPKWESPTEAHLQPLRDYIRTYYRPVQFFEDSGEVIWERKTE